MKTKWYTILITLLMLSFLNLYGIEESNQKKSPESKDAEVSNNILVTLVEIGSVKCIPCKKMAPILEEIKKEYKDQVKVVFHDVWTKEGKPYAKTYKIKLIPTQIFLDKEGKEYFRHIGFFPKAKIIEKLKQKGVKK
jgi:thioredoxin 1